MNLWVNRLYPKKSVATQTREVILGGGDTNLYYTLPVTQRISRQNYVQNQGAQVVNNHTTRAVNNNTDRRVNHVQNSHAETHEGGNVTYQTTVQVDMVNHNQIHGEQDLHRLVDYLRDALEETLSSTAEGVM